MTIIHTPTDAQALGALVAEAAAHGRAIEARGGGSKRAIGRPGRATEVVDLGALAGIVDYAPSELVLTVRPATPLREVEALLAAHDQMLAFEPWDHAALFSEPIGAATIGGVVAAGVAGPRRVAAGGARDHLLGYTAVSGRGEAFKGGGKVVKNVTGYDTAKVMAGSWGQLAILTEVSLKVVPRPRATVTLALSGLAADAAVAAMSQAMGSRCTPTAAAHLPRAGGTQATTIIRLEGFRASVDQRAGQLRGELSPLGDAAIVDGDDADAIWAAARDARPLASAATLWRVHVAPSRAAVVAARLEAAGARWLADWAGALLWIGAPVDVDVRAALAGTDAHAMLVRASDAVRRRVPIRHPEAPAVAALTARVRDAFDPSRVLDPHRFG